MPGTRRIDHIKDKPGRTLADRNVNQHNLVVRAAQGLGLAEKRIIAAALAVSDSLPAQNLIFATQPKHGVMPGWRVRIVALEYAEAYGIDRDTAYEQLKAATDSLFRRHVRILEDTKKGVKERKIRWVSSVEYHHGEGWAELAFTGEMAPYLLGLRRDFTTYKLRQVASFKSVYAWRLMECLASWRDRGEWSVGIHEFCDMMEAPPSCRDDFYNLSARVIKPALRELSDKAGLLISCERTKTGRTVSRLIFRFRPDPQGRLDL